MGNGMNKVLPGLYVGNYRDSKDPQQLDRFSITHIIAIHDSPRRLLSDKHYLCVMAADTPDQNLSQYFSVCNDFIHAARLRDGNVLIHCIAGMSRSVTVAVAYIMSVTPLTWKEALKVVRAGRSVANPNLGFQNQLQEFETYRLYDERKRLRERFPSIALTDVDREQCGSALNNYEELLSNRDICEGNCFRGQDCPTGLCRSDSSKGIFRRKASNSSIRSSRLAAPSTTTQSCPTSPRYSSRSQRGSRQEPSTSSAVYSRRDSEDRLGNKGTSSSNVAGSGCVVGVGGNGGVISGGTTNISNSNLNSENSSDKFGDKNGSKNNSKNGNNATPILHRSASAVSNFKGYNTSGFRSYTGSAPSSVHGSRVDISGPANTGSAIYLGFSPPTRSSYTSGSQWSVTRMPSSGSSAPPTPGGTPPVSPKHGYKRTTSQLSKK